MDKTEGPPCVCFCVVLVGKNKERGVGEEGLGVLHFVKSRRRMEERTTLPGGWD